MPVGPDGEFNLRSLQGDSLAATSGHPSQTPSTGSQYVQQDWREKKKKNTLKRVAYTGHITQRVVLLRLPGSSLLRERWEAKTRAAELCTHNIGWGNRSEAAESGKETRRGNVLKAHKSASEGKSTCEMSPSAARTRSRAHTRREEGRKEEEE